jgi:hypothetical protein
MDLKLRPMALPKRSVRQFRVDNRNESNLGNIGRAVELGEDGREYCGLHVLGCVHPETSDSLFVYLALNGQRKCSDQ